MWKGYISLFIIFILQSSETMDNLILEDKNVIQFFDTQFKESITDLKSGKKVQIMHLGDSHIQIGAFSDGIQSQFAQENIQIDKSWYFPTGLFSNLYNPDLIITKQSHAFITEDVYSSTKKENLGFTGRCFILAKKSNELEFKSDIPFYTMEFMHDSDAQFMVTSSNSTAEKIQITDKYCITKIHFTSVKNKAKLTFKNLGENTCRFYGMRISNENNFSTYSNFGVSGATFANFLESTQFYEQLQSLKPTVLLVTLGTNDSYETNLDSSKFKQNVEVFTSFVRKNLPKTSLVFTNVPDSRYANNKAKHVTFINTYLESYCKDNKIAFWNWNEIMGGENSMELWEKSHLGAGDFLHFSKKGYTILGKHFAKAILAVSKQN